jgi:polysaccharide biosynthesis protein PslG
VAIIAGSLLVLSPLLLHRPSCCADQAGPVIQGVVGVTAETTRIEATRNRDFELIKAEGFPAVRLDIEWPLIEPRKGQFDWTYTDSIVMGAVNHGLTVLGLLFGAPSWSLAPEGRSYIHSPPADPKAFGAFVKLVALRYGKVIHHWEIWNEPNIGDSFSPAANVPLYTAMLQNAYTTIKSVDPHSVVITGGTSPSIDTDDSMTPANFIRQLYANGAGNFFDAIAMHPYSSPEFLSDDGPPYSSHRQIKEVTEVMANNGQGYKRIWYTEFGASTAPKEAKAPDFGGQDTGVSEARQAEILTDGIRFMQSMPNCGPIFIFDHRDGENPLELVNDYGLLRWDFSAKPALSAVQGMLHIR